MSHEKTAPINKRYAVFIEEHLYATFETLIEAEDFIQKRWWDTLSTIWDLQEKRPVYTSLRI